MQEAVSYAVNIISQYGYIIVFLGAIVGGEIFVLAGAFLSSLGWLNIYLVLLFGLVGVVLSDNLWYLAGWRWRQPISRYRRLLLPKFINQKIDVIKGHFNGHYQRFLFFSKFIYSTRIITLVASGHQKVPYGEFFYYNFLSTVIWLIIMAGLGYLMGFSWNYLEKYNSFSRYFALSGLVILIALRFVFKKIVEAKKI